MLIEIFFDGACMSGQQKNGETGVGVAVYIDKLYSHAFSIAVRGDNGSNNIAEWSGCVEALRVAKEIKLFCKEEEIKHHIKIYSDSQLIVNQFNGHWEIKHTSFVKYFKVAREMASDMSFKYLIWVRRESNRQADRLSKIALGKPTTKKDILLID